MSMGCLVSPKTRQERGERSGSEVRIVRIRVNSVSVVGDDLVAGSPGSTGERERLDEGQL
jgi:hypothetical protein